LLKNSFGGQAGYTLIEMLMVIAIMGLLTVAINQVIAHTVRISTTGTDSMTAIKQLESAFHWMNIDVQQAQQTEIERGNGFPLELSWTEWDGTQHGITYAIVGSEIKRSVSINGTQTLEMPIARYINTAAAATYCRLSSSGAFLLPDDGDNFTITGGQEATSGHISIGAGSISVVTTGTATYNAGDWSTPAAGDSITITAESADTSGIWNSQNTTAFLALTQDTDADASLTGGALIVTLTAFGGERSTHSETRQGLIFSRS
jgi:prepilin-type N-terminal cleavage/methylation domain-containing protein